MAKASTINRSFNSNPQMEAALCIDKDGRYRERTASEPEAKTSRDVNTDSLRYIQDAVRRFEVLAAISLNGRPLRLNGRSMAVDFRKEGVYSSYTLR